MPNEGNTPLDGDALRQYLKREVVGLRGSTDLVPKAQLAPPEGGLAALRYFGKNLLGTAQAAGRFMAEIEGTGVLKGLGFTSQQLQDAIAHVGDTHLLEATLTGLAEDAHNKAVHARATLARMTLKLVQSQRHIVSSPATDPALLAQIKDAGAPLQAELQSLQSGRQGNREVGDELRQAKDALGTAQQQNQQHETAAAVREAQKALRLKTLAGEPLRPEDLVIPQVPPDKPDKREKPRARRARRP